MKALIVAAPGEEPELGLVDIPRPSTGPHDVLIEVAACGLCHHDVAVMRGLLRRGFREGGVLGHEISGTVAEVGDSVHSITVGQHVVAALTAFCGRCERCLSGREYRCLSGRGVGHALDGGFSQFVSLPETSVVPVPQEMDRVKACVLACPAGVTVQAVEDVARLQPGETALVTGAGGGLGVHAIQIAVALGARVLAATTSPQKVEALEQLGAESVILSTEGLDFSEIALAMTDDAGADVVVDTVGSATLEQSLRSLGHYGRLVALGEVTGQRAPLSVPELLFRDATIAGSTGAGLRHIQRAAEMVQSESLRPIVSQTFTLDEALEAYRLVRDGASFGRVALTP